MKNELWLARNNPSDGRIAELFDEDETLWLIGFNAEPIVMESGTSGRTHQGFLLRLHLQRKDKSEFSPAPIFFSAEAMEELKQYVYTDFNGFGVTP